MKLRQPEVGIWYENIDQQALFEIVAVDEDDGTLGIQYFDGDLEELELETFWDLNLRNAEQPEDWSGPYEIEEDAKEDQDYTAADQQDPFFPHDDFDAGEVRIYDDY